MADFLSPEQLQEKWSPVIEHTDLPKIEDAHKRHTTAVLLENQERALREERATLMETPGTVMANAANYDPVLIGLVRRAMPQLIAYDICGVQPMTMPTGLVFALTSRYGNASGAEALFNEANAAYSGAYASTAGDGTTVGTSPVAGDDNGLDPWATNAPGNFTGVGGNAASGGGVANKGLAMQSSQYAEGVNPAEMSFKIEKSSVTAKSRALKAEYTIELAQDLKAVHGLDAEGELSNILSNEILAEINREVVRSIYTVAKTGAQLCTTAGTFDLDVDANGRWSVERFKGLMFQIEREANYIGQLTRRGRGNFILCSADVASALSMTGTLDTGAALGKGSLNVDDTSTTFAGVLNGKYKVYIDPYMANGTNDQFVLVGYRGSSPFDAGLFYCPYVPLQMMRAVDPTTFQPKIGFKTRYGLIQHPLNSADNSNTDPAVMKPLSNRYYRIFKVANLA